MENLENKIEEYTVKRHNMWIMLAIGILLIGLGGGILFLPDKSYDILLDKLKDYQFIIEWIMKLWFVFPIVGVLMIIIVFASHNYCKIIIFEEGIRLAGIKGKYTFHYLDIKKIDDGHKFKIYLYNHRNITIYKKYIKDYVKFFHCIKEQHKKAVLGKEFPQNIDTLEFQIGNNIKVEKGKIIYKDREILFSKIITYKVYQIERSFNLGIVLNIPSIKEKAINISPDEICNEDALYALLKIVSTEEDYQEVRDIF